MLLSLLSSLSPLLYSLRCSTSIISRYLQSFWPPMSLGHLDNMQWLNISVWVCTCVCDLRPTHILTSFFPFSTMKVLLLSPINALCHNVKVKSSKSFFPGFRPKSRRILHMTAPPSSQYKKKLKKIVTKYFKSWGKLKKKSCPSQVTVSQPVCLPLSLVIKVFPISNVPPVSPLDLSL